MVDVTRQLAGNNLLMMLAARPGETDDLSSLSSLDEATLLEELSIRYSKDKIYVNEVVMGN